jgi:hypothetical protein
MSDLPHLQIIRETEFDEQLHARIADSETADDFTAGAEELLAREPRSGLPVTNEGDVWYLPMSPVAGRRVSIFYSFDARTVILLAIVAYDD